MRIVTVDNSNKHVYMNLAQAYEAEFSKIMQKKPDENGLFPLDTHLGDTVTGYLLYLDGIPAGHTAIASDAPNQYEICDFYIVPFFRQNQIGKRFITQLFERFGGRWEIKQVAGAEHAVKFWREVLQAYTHGQFSEDQYKDEKWGQVTRQRFTHGAEKV